MTAGETVEANIFNKTAKIKLTGTYLDENGKEKEIKKEIENEVQWEGSAEAQLAGEVSKYLPYKIGNQKGVLVQVKIRSNVKDNSLPTQKTKLEVEVLELANNKPERITVVANSTEATNGKTNNIAKYTYNEETGKIEIEVENKEENGKISWKKNAVDEYLVNYIYTGEEVYNQIKADLEKAKTTIKTEEETKAGQTNENAITGEIQVKAEIESYNNKETKTEKTGKISYSIEEEKGQIVDTMVTAPEKVSKGYIYANYEKAAKEAKKETIEEKKETNYTVNYTAQINDKALTEAVEFITTPEKYIDQDEQEHTTKSENIYTKTVIISEENFNKMLGEEGKIEITDKEGNKLAEINKDTEKDQNRIYTVNISAAKTNEISIKTSKPITEGSIIISVEKAITGKQSYKKDEMKNFQELETQVITKVYALENVTEQNKSENIDESQTEEETVETIEILNNTGKAKINLTEPVSKAEISVGMQNLSTTVENKDVELRAVLDTSNVENALFKNPVLQIILPENIEKLDIKSVDLLLEDELKIKETKIEESNGRKIIKVTLEGTQTKYMNNDNQSQNQANVISKGANIAIKANITFKKLTPSSSSNIYLYYTNENTNLFEQYYKKPTSRMARAARTTTNQETIGLASTEIEIVSPNGVVTENYITGYKQNESISNITTEKQEAKIDAHAEKAQQVTFGGTIVNNYNNSIENVMILGRIPFSGNKQIDTDQDLGSNFSIPMKEKISITGIDTNKAKIYYSKNGEADKNLTGPNNGWTETPSNLAQVKSYLIITSGEIAKGTKIGFNYKAELPANLNYDSNTYTTYKVYYDNNMPDATLGESQVAGIIGLTTGQAPGVELSVKSATATVREGQIVKMIVTVKNVSNSAIENAKLLITAPEGTIHTEIKEGTRYYEDSKERDKVISIGTIKPGETKTEEYELRIKKGTVLTEGKGENGQTITIEEKKYPGDKEIQNIIRLTANNLSGEVKSESCIFKVEQGDLSITNIPKNFDEIVLRKGNTAGYTVKVENISYDKHLNNVTLNIEIPTGIKIKDVYYSDSMAPDDKDKENITINENNISINLGTLQSMNAYIKEMIENKTEINQDTRIRTTTYVYIELEIDNFTGRHDLIMTATADNVPIHYSNVRKILTEKVDLKITQKELDNSYIKEGSKYTYHFTIENVGEIRSLSNKIEMELPEEIKLVRAEYVKNGKKITTSSATNRILTIDIAELAPNEKIDLAVTVQANLLPDQKDKEVITKASMQAEGFTKIESNKVKAIIEYDVNAHQNGQGTSSDGNNQNPQQPQTKQSYRIIGTAWVDSNKNAQRDEGEELLAGVQVVLLYKSNSQTVKDQTTGADKVTTTNNNGEYEFTNLTPNEYIVLFLYDAGKYSITDYKKQGVAQTLNSDATSMKIVLNGEQRQAGVSDTIKITDSNVRDIDIGLFVAEKFDLRLDKYISKITVTTPSNGTKVYNYENSKITKREIADKDVNNSSIIVEYKIVVTNEGQVDGYVKKIIDYLPDGVRFNSELNKDWYISDNNGAVYNTALANEKIEPGQSKEVTLVLSLNITDKNIGTLVNNNAEIYESYNELGLEDIDSIPANRLETEDDMSNADIMLGVQTGTIILYTTLSIAVVLLLGIGIYEIRRRVLIKKEN